jgi:hypothetical protein
MSIFPNNNVRRGRWLAVTLVMVAAALLTSSSAAHAVLTTESCMAKKLKEWGKLRKCQATENGKALQGKPADSANCQTKFDDKLATISAQATTAAIACRYGVNAGPEAGTVTDYDTGLQWEQKTDDGSVHDKDNTYTWNTTGGTIGHSPNGTAFTAFLGTLNNGTSGDAVTTAGCFAGHCDWRLPAIGELAGIVDLGAPGCAGGSPCIDQTVFGPTVANKCWSATGGGPPANPDNVFAVDFGSSYIWVDDRASAYSVRGVRSGL